MRRESIIKRVLAKEILRQAFAALNLFIGGEARVFMASSGMSLIGTSRQLNLRLGPLLEQLLLSLCRLGFNKTQMR